MAHLIYIKNKKDLSPKTIKKRHKLKLLFFKWIFRFSLLANIYFIYSLTNIYSALLPWWEYAKNTAYLLL